MTVEEKINQNQEEIPKVEVQEVQKEDIQTETKEIPEEKEHNTHSVFSTDIFQHIENLNLTTPSVVEDNILIGEEETASFSISNYNFIGKILIGVWDSVAILGAWVYARQYIPEIQYSEIQKIIGLRETEKTELGKLLGRILAKYQWVITEEVLFVISLVRIYSIALMEYLKQNTPKRKTKRKTQKQTKKNKKQIKTKDVLEEIKPEE